jgi:3-hydroxyacyl-[acyl-carrier-protein] dehydratase
VDPVALIPHRPPWLLVDAVEVEADTETAHGRREASASDPWCAGGVLPPVLVVEALAQTAAAVMGAAFARHAEARGGAGAAGAAEHRGYLAEIRDFRFPAPARAGLPVELVARRTASLGRLHRFRARATQGGEVVAEGDLSFAVEAGW